MDTRCRRRGQEHTHFFSVVRDHVGAWTVDEMTVGFGGSHEERNERKKKKDRKKQERGREKESKKVREKEKR